MRITHIFEVIKDRLYDVEYDHSGQSVLDVLYEQWTDPVYLEEFFETHKADLYSGFYGLISIEDAIERTIEDADELFDFLYELDEENLDARFKPLNDQEHTSYDFQKCKAKGNLNKSWLRVYAVFFFEAYVITGGAIKLTQKMQERKHTQQELDKLEATRNLLKLNNAEPLFVYLNI